MEAALQAPCAASQPSCCGGSQHVLKACHSGDGLWLQSWAEVLGLGSVDPLAGPRAALAGGWASSPQPLSRGVLLLDLNLGLKGKILLKESASLPLQNDCRH